MTSSAPSRSKEPERDELGFIIPTGSEALDIANRLKARGTLGRIGTPTRVALNADAARAAIEAARKSGAIQRGNRIEKNGRDAAEHAGVHSQWIAVTPEIASAWLVNNYVNRPVKKDVVAAYARDMKGGKWRQTHQGVAFNDLDELIDGQHRLMAVVESGCTIEMMVTFGLPAKRAGSDALTVMDCVDRGCPRSVADQLKIQHGIKNGTEIAQITKSLAALCSTERTRRLSVGQTLDIYADFREAADWVLARRGKAHGLKQIGVAAAFAFAITADPRVQDAFIPLMDGTLAAGDALWHLRAFLTSDDAVLLSRSSDRGVAELVLQALWLQGTARSIESLELGTDGRDHFASLQPERVARIAALFALEAA